MKSVRTLSERRLAGKRFAISLLAAAITPMAANAQELALNDRSQENILETIIVVGEKADRSLKDSTSSIAVIPEEALENMQYDSFTNAVSDIPNVISLSGAVPDIRGVTGNGSAGGFNSISGGAKARVSMLIDGVAEPFVADLGGDTGLWDLEQIEVYRGPQSTTNGRNSIGGAIYMKTKDPTDTWEGAARIGYRNEERYIDTAFAVSGPLIDNLLSFRLSAENIDGQTITDDNGYATNPPNYDPNKLDTERYRGKLKWTPTDKLTALLTYSSNDEQGDSGRIYYAATNLDDHDRIFYRDTRTESDTVSVKVDYAFSDKINLETLVAHMDYQWGFDTYDPTPEEHQKLAFDETNITVDSKLSIGDDSDTFYGFIGLAYFERDHDLLSTDSIEYSGDDSSDSVATYGEATLRLNQQFNLILGGRYERETQNRHFIYGAIDSTLEEEHSEFLPKIALQYEMSPETTLALSYRQGYNAPGGALNSTAGEYYYFDEESVDTFEFSSRSNLLGDKLYLSANVFFNQYDGYQAVSSSRSIVNMDEVETYGLEMELTANLTEDLQVNGGLGLLHTEITNPGSGYAEVEGNELNSAPELSLNLGVKYWFTDGLNVGVSANYVDDYYGDFENTDARTAGDYTLVRLTANYEVGHVLISGFVNNLLDEEALLSNEPVSARYPSGYVAITDPRNIGISATYNF